MPKHTDKDSRFQDLYDTMAPQEKEPSFQDLYDTMAPQPLPAAPPPPLIQGRGPREPAPIHRVDPRGKPTQEELEQLLAQDIERHRIATAGTGDPSQILPIAFREFEKAAAYTGGLATSAVTEAFTPFVEVPYERRERELREQGLSPTRARMEAFRQADFPSAAVSVFGKYGGWEPSLPLPGGRKLKDVDIGLKGAIQIATDPANVLLGLGAVTAPIRAPIRAALGRAAAAGVRPTRAAEAAARRAATEALPELGQPLARVAPIGDVAQAGVPARGVPIRVGELEELHPLLPQVVREAPTPRKHTVEELLEAGEYKLPQTTEEVAWQASSPPPGSPGTIPGFAYSRTLKQIREKLDDAVREQRIYRSIETKAQRVFDDLDEFSGREAEFLEDLVPDKSLYQTYPPYPDSEIMKLSDIQAAVRPEMARSESHIQYWRAQLAEKTELDLAAREAAMERGIKEIGLEEAPTAAARGGEVPVEWKGAKAELEELRRIDAEGNLDLMGRPVARPPLAGLREQELVASARARAEKASGEAYERAKPTEGEPTGFWAGNVFREITDEDALVAARMASNDVFRQFQRTTGIDVEKLIHTIPKELEELWQRPIIQAADVPIRVGELEKLHPLLGGERGSGIPGGVIQGERLERGVGIGRPAVPINMRHEVMLEMYKHPNLVSDELGQVVRFKDRDVVLVEMANGTRQPFYRSTGRASGVPGRWFPFDGVGPGAGSIKNLLIKDRFTEGVYRDPANPLYRYGGKEDLKAIGDNLGELSIPKGRDVVDNVEVNKFLDKPTTLEELSKESIGQFVPPSRYSTISPATSALPEGAVTPTPAAARGDVALAVDDVVPITPPVNPAKEYPFISGHAATQLSQEARTPYTGTLGQPGPSPAAAAPQPTPGKRPFGRRGERPVGPATAEILEHVSFKEPKAALGDRMRGGLRRLVTAIFDDRNPIKRVVDAANKYGAEITTAENPYIWSRLLEGVGGKSNTFIEDGTFGKKFWRMEEGRAVPDFRGPSLYKILAPVREGRLFENFSAYLTDRRAIELIDKGVETGIDRGVAVRSLNELNRAHPEFAQIAQRLYRYQDELLQYGEESGIFSPEMLARLRQYKNYVPFHRVMEQLEVAGFMGRKMANIASPIKRIKGSDRLIISPLESIIKNTHVIIAAADRNQVGILLAQMAERIPELRSLFRAIPTPTSRVATVTAKDLKISIDGLSAVDAELLVDIFRPMSYAKGANEVTVLINGKKHFFEVDPDLYRGLLAHDRAEFGMLGRFFGFPARLLRAGAVLAPDFMIKNPMRDQLTAFVYSRYGFIPAVDWIKGIGQMLGRTEDVKLWRMSGGEMANLVSVDRAVSGRTVDEIAKAHNFTNYSKNPIDWLRAASEIGENGSRIGEFVRGIRAGDDPLTVTFSTRELTQDFSKMGTATRAINQFIPFFAANVGSWSRLATEFRTNPTRASVKAFLGITIPSLLLYSVNRLDPRYAETPQWQKDTFWIIPNPGTRVRIPKPFMLGQVFGSVPERFFEFLDNRDPKVFEESMRNALQQGTPGYIPQAMLPWLENMTNHSFFLDRPIVPRGLEGAPPQIQYSGQTSEAAKALGKWINFSPAQIDNVWRAYTGGLGRLFTDALDPILKGTGITPDIPDPSPTLADMPILRAFFVRDPTGSSSESVNRFYDRMNYFEGIEKVWKNHIDMGEADAALRYKDNNPEAALNYDYRTGSYYSSTARYLRSIASVLAKTRGRQREVYRSRNMTSAEKRSRLDEMNRLITSEAQKGLTYLENNLP